MKPAVYNIKNHTTGDTWKGLSMQLLDANENPIDITDCNIKCQFRQRKNEANHWLTLSTETEGIEITDAENGTFAFKEQVINLPAKTYVYDVQFTFPDGKVKTYVEGTWTILADVTR
jgi:hypothetical protein